MDSTIIKDFIFKPLTLGSLIMVISYAFETISKSIPKERHDELADKLASFNLTNLVNEVSNALSASFDNIFGEKYLSVKSFKKATIFSFISVIVFYFLALSLHEISWEGLIWKDWFFWLIHMTINFTIFNLIPDYFIYVKTRYVLHLLADGNHNYTRVLIIDLLVTLVFGITKFLLITYVLSTIFEFRNDEMFVSGWNALTLSVSNFDGTGVTYLNAVPGVFIYSSLFFSVFPWFYILSSFLANNSKKFFEFSYFIKKWIDFVNKPIESLKTISVIVIILLGLIVFILDLIF
ncbi:hypothetical protein SAMN04488029_3158 [Reichenbachiella faecimaris]|uniref:Uncharacterized protein n=1 Tax=Reichenbachiella faecimaris TaxID=692418 RepID=A0A1W2GJX4_REIFA|nr:hypothetical protein [Reichenbachiella faecimaris]SMD36950.1 hypothetical protein SAMN04488029_3158 [Reichenbachiella faecimaris]